VVRSLLEGQGITVDNIMLGEVDITYDAENVDINTVSKLLEQDGFELVADREEQLVEQIKATIIDLVHHTTFNAMVRNSDFLVEKFNLSYQYISGIFSKHAPTTIEKYIILQKIEKVKELIQYGELTLSEIAFMMGYSSVQYLSTQFKSITGISVTDFKKEPGKYRQNIGNL
jgi:YesN/AraC family two-component response regulator